MDVNVNVVKERIQRALLQVNNLSTNSNNVQFLRELRECLTNLHRIRLRLRPTNYLVIKNSLEQLIQILTENSDVNSFTYLPSTSTKTTPGRPEIIITGDQLQLLHSQGYTAKKMAQEFKCSISTIYKRCYAIGIKLKNKYTIISYDDLKNKIKYLHEKYPKSGSVMMDGYLKSEGLVVQRKRIRDILAEIDPLGTAKRWSGTIKRRVYKVATPNSLWHMDAHMKLARWGLVTHGCIDGYSRTIIYLACTTSVSAQTVINLFVPAIQKYGVPSRVRSDHGFENLFVAILMNSVRGIHRGSHITGKSVHNQRIERLWKDVFQQVIQSFYDLFYKMETDGILDPNNISHIYVLHKVYLQEIDMNLKQFISAWNHHKLRTEGNRSPQEVWINGFLNNINSEHTAITELLNNQDTISARLQNIFEQQYGMNTTALTEDINTIAQSSNDLVLTPEQLRDLNEILNSNVTSQEKYILCMQCLNS